jgi:hypothetical protein
MAAIVAAVALLRWRLIEVPLERDEGEYAYNAQLVLAGNAPFEAAHATQKLPGVALMCAPALAVVPDLPAGLHAELLAIHAASCVLLFLLLRAFLGPLPAVCGAAAFSVLALGSGVLGMAAHATHFVVFWALAGFVLLRPALGREASWLRLILSGAAFGCALLMRQPSAAYLLAAGVWLASTDRARGTRTRRSLARVAVLACAATFPLALTMAWMASADSFATFWFWTVEYASSYGTQMSSSDGLRALRATSWAIGIQAWPLLILAAIGLIVLCFRRDGWTRLAWPWLAATALAVAAGWYFRPHYFVQALPVAAALVATAVGAMPLASRRRSIAAGACVALAIAITLGQQRELLFEATPEQYSRRVYTGNLFVEAEDVARELRERAAPGDTLAILGSEPQIYALSGLRSASPYIYTYSFMEVAEHARRFQDEFIAQIERARPRFVLNVVGPASWLARDGSDMHVFDWSARFLRERYELVGVCAWKSEPLWDAAARAAQPTQRAHIQVFQRRDQRP